MWNIPLWLRRWQVLVPVIALSAAAVAADTPAADFLKREQVTPPAPAPRITDVQHSVLHFDKSTYCGHPRMVAFEYFGLGEILVGHFHAPSKYQVYDDVRHVSYQSRAVCLLQRSTDYGKTWSEPTVVSGKGAGAWKNPGREGHMYRSPWPIQLADGRILVIFTRRRQPTGIGGIVSSDPGKTWSHEFVLRDDGNKWNQEKHPEGDWGDLGYPVVCQFEDGRIFTAYYYNNDEAHEQGGTRFIAATTFRLESEKVGK